ncbi:type IV toxin-antitoxin system AbiEi family antitoxin domain-containing protein [Nocardioides sp. zg-DK7169]|uniref:type IV toxin-antitoxin system AbiEi family antitoxin domain-containing protein n=1 Tax=Nocardioides sp. zg-DK7169 TaxID=2736600 RepID=UPI001554A586|nr:type IV toxin-antitoxin system AbiEi family antitoxin domain-containing protein [Nocardioides sp. zg-DK7169]NPC95851.1 type IV toxin-antitoxin system AbiEi family antitoxin domain-containing protein [Nocardioides sp. zg-DK7169]
MSVLESLERLGGAATTGQLVALTSRSAVERAVASGDLVRLARGRWALPGVDLARQAAHRLAGTVSHTSAALAHGWAVKRVPERPHVTLPRSRRAPTRPGAVLHWADLTERDGLVTTPERTLVDCLRTLPFDEALAVADSALRTGFGTANLAELADGVRGAGAARVRAVAAAATPLAANPFESVLRALALDAGLGVEPQVEIREPELLGCVDLADRGRRIIAEADSFAWHGGRDQLAHDCRRYNGFAVHGWLVLRFSWEDVMLDPAAVRQVLEAAAHARAEVRCGSCGAG